MSWKELFYKSIKVKARDEDILFIGCIHRGHDPNWETPIWKLRGYNSAKECDDGIVERWNSKANDNTIGFLLGDNVFGNDGLDTIKDLFKKLKFKQAFVMGGNHTSGFKQLLEECEENIYRFDDKEVILTPNYLEAFINGQSVVMSHYPILSFNGQAKASICLYCHVHGNLGKSEVGKAYINSGVRAYEVSVEVNPFPPNFADIKRIMKDKAAVSFDHHDSNTQNPF